MRSQRWWSQTFAATLLGAACAYAGCTNPIARPSNEQPRGSLAAATPARQPRDERAIAVDELLDPRVRLAVVGQAGYDYHRLATDDFDGDGTQERAFLIANAPLVDGRPLWDDGHTWQLYFEEPSGERTYAYARFVQLGMVEASPVQEAEDATPRIVLVERAPQHVAVYEIGYQGPDDVQVRDVSP